MTDKLIISEVHTHMTDADMGNKESIEFSVWRTESNFEKYRTALIRTYGQPVEHAVIRDTTKNARLEMFIFYTNLITK